MPSGWLACLWLGDADEFVQLAPEAPPYKPSAQMRAQKNNCVAMVVPHDSIGRIS
jgi:hypothetical protein